MLSDRNKFLPSCISPTDSRVSRDIGNHHLKLKKMVRAATAASARVESEASAAGGGIKNTHVEVQQGEGDVDFKQVTDSLRWQN